MGLCSGPTVRNSGPTVRNSGPTVRNSGSTAGNSGLTTTLDSGADSDSGYHLNTPFHSFFYAVGRLTDHFYH